jgi:organic radical activating enzyme
MPQQPTLKISEIFFSLQGEGLRQGEPTIFIRLAGCNLRCSFCDTKYAWEGGRDKTTTDILDEVNKIKHSHPAKWICFTGGEPLLQDIRPLLLQLKKENFEIQVETNATVFKRIPVDWYTLSPKPEKYYFHPLYKSRAKEIKLIVTRELKLSTILKIREAIPVKTPILLQPQSNRKWSFDQGLKLIKEALNSGIENIKLSIQLHKILKIR